MKEAQSNPLLCDPKNGFCGIPGDPQDEPRKEKSEPSAQPIRVIYFTDPICSACWGIEPQLRKLKLEYGKYLEFDYRMGGLLPDWNYNNGGISKPSDVAHHWEEVSQYYDMPIDGSVWLEDPLHSSYPPSISFKAVQMQDPEKAVIFLREIREMVFTQKKNITKAVYLEEAVMKAGADPDRFRKDFQNHAVVLFEQDLEMGRKLGIRGFPTVFFQQHDKRTEIVYGTNPYEFFEKALLKLDPDLKKNPYKKDWESLFTIYPSMTNREFSELTGMLGKDGKDYLEQLTNQGILHKYTLKNGAIWSIKGKIKN